MRINVDLRNNRLMLVPGFSRRITTGEIEFKLSRGVRVEVVFLQDGDTPVKVSANQLNLCLKTLNNFDGVVVAAAQDWVIPLDSDENPIYRATLNTNVEPLLALFTAVAPALPPPSVNLMGELNWRMGVDLPTATETFPVVVFNDVCKDGDLVPDPLDPPEAYVRFSHVGQPDGVAGLDGSATVLGSASDVLLGFTETPAPLEVDQVLITRNTRFTTEGHFLYATGTLTGPIVFDILFNGEKKGEATLNGVSVAAVTLSEQVDTSGVTVVSLRSPDAILANPDALQLYLKGKLI